MKMQTGVSLLLLPVMLLIIFVAPDAGAQTLEKRVETLENQIDRMASVGLVLFLYGVFCALWAQTTNRSAWGWFFLGLFFGPITTIFLLSKNAEDRLK